MDCKGAVEELERAIEDLKERNRDTPILVEGEKDVKALHALGITGTILTVYRGKEIANMCDDIASRYREIILLTDWDSEGWYLFRRIEKNLSGRTRCIADYRLIFAKNAMVKAVESLPSFLSTLHAKMRGERKFDE